MVARSRIPPPNWNFHRGKNALDRACVHRPPSKSAIEIDNVQVFKSLRRERSRLLRGIAVKNRRPRHVALLKTHGLAVFQIYGRKQNHGVHVRKLAISAKPSFWLFSGWNWVPTMLSRATMAVTGPP
jgi:hypothetical protein